MILTNRNRNILKVIGADGDTWEGIEKKLGCNIRGLDLNNLIDNSFIYIDISKSDFIKHIYFYRLTFKAQMTLAAYDFRFSA
jgi:hypothetical protein